jgi:hypothetical protein
MILNGVIIGGVASSTTGRDDVPMGGRTAHRSARWRVTKRRY